MLSKGNAAGSSTKSDILIGPYMPLLAGFCRGFVPSISISNPCIMFKPASTYDSWVLNGKILLG